MSSTHNARLLPGRDMAVTHHAPSRRTLAWAVHSDRTSAGTAPVPPTAGADGDTRDTRTPDGWDHAAGSGAPSARWPNWSDGVARPDARGGFRSRYFLGHGRTAGRPGHGRPGTARSHLSHRTGSVLLHQG